MESIKIKTSKISSLENGWQKENKTNNIYKTLQKCLQAVNDIEKWF